MDPSQQESKDISCANPDCNVAVNGRCIEGFENPDACPQFGKILTELSQTFAEESEQQPGLELPSSSNLGVAEANSVLAERTTHVVAIVGPQDAGKTSLIAGMYDQFQTGPVDAIAFASSRTLHSFEQACHDSRAASRRAEPHIERTVRGEVRFYHLDLVGGDFDIALLLADRAGEEYAEVRNDPDTATDFPELSRADTLSILVDGAKLLDSGLRHNVKADARQTLQAFFDADVIRPWQKLAIVLTKLDEVRAAPGCERALGDFQSLCETVADMFGRNFAEVRRFAIAASPKSNTAERGEGLSDLLKFWTAAAPRYEPKGLAETSPTPTRAFGRLQRVPMEAR